MANLLKKQKEDTWNATGKTDSFQETKKIKRNDLNETYSFYNVVMLSDITFVFVCRVQLPFAYFLYSFSFYLVPLFYLFSLNT